MENFERKKGNTNENTRFQERNEKDIARETIEVHLHPDDLDKEINKKLL